ncbi:hypothetical protein ACFL27_25325, partial [candidate division CSSED10-310 bacterium]
NLWSSLFFCINQHAKLCSKRSLFNDGFTIIIYFMLYFLLISPPCAADITTGLVAYYPFNGNADDESGTGNHGTVNGAVLATDRFDQPDSAYSFDGLNDYISIPHHATLNVSNSTFSAWVKSNDMAKMTRIFSQKIKVVPMD